MKLLTLSEAESKRRKAVEFLYRIGKDDEADRFEEMTPEEYAEHKGAEILPNPERRTAIMARSRVKSKDELEAELDEANDYIEQLEAKLDDIAGIVGDEDEDDETDSDFESEEDAEAE
jgi:hypothetical protein